VALKIDALLGTLSTPLALENAVDSGVSRSRGQPVCKLL
jgi:hypothetical protein